MSPTTLITLLALAAAPTSPPPDTQAVTEPTSHPTSEPTSQPSPEEVQTAIAAFRADTLKKVVEELATLRFLPPAALKDVFQFRAEPTGLVVVTRLLETDGDVTFPVTDFPGYARLGLTGKPNAELATPASFKLILHRFDDPSVTYSQTEVWTNSLISQFQLTHTAESLHHTYSVQLIQSPRILGELNSAPDEALRLLVRNVDLDSGDATLDVRIAAPDLQSLRRKYPRETSQYLRPILDDMEQLSPLFSADERAAWQVLGSAPELSLAATQRLADVLTRLESDKFSDRQKAQRDLKALGQQAALALRSLDRTALTPNQNAEIDAFLSSYSPLNPEETQRLALSPDFLLDCMELPDPTLRAAAWTKLQSLPSSLPLPPTLTFNPTADPTTREAAISNLRQHFSPLPTTRPTP